MNLKAEAERVRDDLQNSIKRTANLQRDLNSAAWKATEEPAQALSDLSLNPVSDDKKAEAEKIRRRAVQKLFAVSIAEEELRILITPKLPSRIETRSSKSSGRSRWTP